MLSQTQLRGRRARRSLREWAVRGALACGIAVLGYQSLVFTAAQVLLRSHPDTADARITYDGRLSAARAAALTAAGHVTTEDREQAEIISRSALRHDPTTVSAATALGIANLARGNTADARRLLTYAQMLSRRNIPTQLWSIEDAVGRGDIQGALRWYDITLRTHPNLSEVLYPVLARASRDAAIRAALVRTLAGKPPWLASYLGFAGAQKDDAQNTAALFAGLRARGVLIPSDAQTSVIGVLLDAGNVDEAWRYYAAIRPGASRTRARDPRFAALLDTPSAFDWITLSDNSLTASIQRSRDGGVFEFAAPASIGGPVLQQVQLLPVGTYRLSGHSEGIVQEARALPYWTLTCRTDGRELGRVAMPNSAQAGGAFWGTLTVPANCPIQVLTLFVQASDAIEGISGQIDRVMLAPAAGAAG